MTAIDQLNPTQFENLVFDLIVGRGFSNVTWRTPGADGGRDIEAVSFQRDLSGAHTLDKWYVECKKYSTSVDWPTIYPKLAYADVAGADYLLLCTNAKVTPNAITRVDEWNSKHRKPKIRVWAGHDMEGQLMQHEDIMLKYGLANVNTGGPSILALSLVLSKSVGSYYAKATFSGNPIDPMLNAGHAIAQLLQIRIEQVQKYGKIYISPISSVPEESGIDFTGAPEGIDGPAFLALSAYLFALLKGQVKVHFKMAETFEFEGKFDVGAFSERYLGSLQAIALWGDLEIEVVGKLLKFQQRGGMK